MDAGCGARFGLLPRRKPSCPTSGRKLRLLTSDSLDFHIPQGYQGVRPKVMLMYLLNERNQLG